MLLDSGEAGEAAQGILPLSRLEFDEATSTGNPHFLLERPAAEGALRFGRRISQGVAAQARAQLSQKSRDLPALGDAMVETDIEAVAQGEIGRASCRERGCPDVSISGGAVY